MCCDDVKAPSKVPFEVDNPRYEVLDGGYTILADVYNASPGYDTFGIVFKLKWSNGQVDEYKATMWLDQWARDKYPYHANIRAKDESGQPLMIKSLEVEPDFAVAKNGAIWGNMDGFKNHLLMQELLNRKGA